MHNNNMFRTRKTFAAALFAIAFALLCIAFVRESRQQGIEGWTPVNEALKEAIGSLASPSVDKEKEVAADLATKQGIDLSTDQPTSQLSQTTSQLSDDPLGQLPDPTSNQSSSHVSDPTSSPASTDSASENVEEAPRDTAPGTLDLNRATEADLDALPGIGPSKAKAILAHRDKIGGFRKVEQLLDVKGIGPKVFEHLSSLVHVAAAK